MALATSPVSPLAFQRSLKSLGDAVGFKKRSAAILPARSSEDEVLAEDAPLLEDRTHDVELGDLAHGTADFADVGNAAREGPEATAHIRVTGMTCSACSASVEKAVGQLDGVRSVSVALLQNMAEVVYDPGRLPVSILTKHEWSSADRGFWSVGERVSGSVYVSILSNLCDEQARWLFPDRSVIPGRSVVDSISVAAANTSTLRLHF